MSQKLDVVIITGMSGAGKTVAVQLFEDLRFFVIDNMLPTLAEKFVDVIEQSDEFSKMAMVMDTRAKGFYDQVLPAIQKLRRRDDINVRVLFLDALDAELVARYKETRRAHPLAKQDGVLAGIQRERKLLGELASQADVKIDTTNLQPRDLRTRLMEIFNNGKGTEFYIDVMSFGFKYGLPLDADIVMDVRFLPNPFYVPELKHLTGNDRAVQEYVMQSPEAQEFYRHLYSLLITALPGYIKEGKTSVTIAIGCTGGQHRSVTIANRLAADLKKEHYMVNAHHRDVDKAQ